MKKLQMIALTVLMLGGSTVFFTNTNNVQADCTLTTASETDGRCFMEGRDFACLAREEDPNCFVNP
jgi:hypothetical protein